jgi:hypothetical protein
MCIYSTASIGMSTVDSDCASIARCSWSRNARAEWVPWTLSSWFLAATSISVARLRPGRTGSCTDVEDAVEPVVEPEPVVLLALGPLAQLDDELDLLGVAHGGDAEQVLDVDDAEATDLHVVADDAGAPPDDVGALPPDLDHVVGDQPVAAHHEVERGLALADAALAEQQHADAEHVEQHAVHVGRRRHPVRHPAGHRGDEVRRGQRRHQHGHAARLGGDRQLLGRRQAAAHHDARRVAREQRRDPELARRLVVAQVLDLGAAEHEHAARVQLLGPAGQREPRLLDARHGHDAIDAGLARDGSDFQLRAFEQLTDRDHARHSVLGILVCNHVVHRFGVGRRQQAAAELGVLEHPADARQCLEVRTGRRLRRDEHEEQVGGLAVHRVELDTPGGPPQARHDLADRAELAVGDRDALSDRRRRQLLSLDQDPGQGGAVDPRVMPRHVMSELLENTALVCRLQRRNDHVASNKVDDLHQPLKKLPLS